MDSIIYKYRRLLTEGYNFTNVDEVYDALETNQIGVKTQPEYKKKEKWSYTCEKLRKFFNKCEGLGIKDTTYGVQLLLSKVPPYNLEDIIGTNGLYELLRSRKKPWVKELKEYQTLMNSKVWSETAVNNLHDFEKAVQDNQNSHGKAAKGSGYLQGVKTLYDDGTWKLLQPTSFQGEKAAAFYIKNGEEVPTKWCTRCDEIQYNNYTKLGPLYIIRNMKSGKSYQLSFKEYGVEFLDQDNRKGDEVTTGDLNKIPDNLLKLVKHPKNGRTLLDYKTSRNKSLNAPEKKGYLKAENVGTDQNNFKYGPTVQLENNVCKKDILNFSYDSIQDSLSDYFISEKPIQVSIKYVKRHKATAYFLKGKEDAMIIFQTLGNNGKSYVDGTFLETKKFNKGLTPEEKNNIFQIAQKDFGITKSRERVSAQQDRKDDLMKKYNNKMLNMSQEGHNKIVDNINSKLDFRKSKLFKGLNSVPFPFFGRTGEWGTKAMAGSTLVKYLSFIPTEELERRLPPNMKNSAVDVIFKNLNDENNIKNADTVTWNKANAAILVTGYDRDDYLKLPKEEFELCKKIAIEIQKEFIKDPDYRNLNMKRKIEQTAQSQKENRGKTLTKQQLENTVGKDMAHRLTHLDNEKPGTRFPVHVMKSINQATHRPDLYEEVNYFDY